MSSKMMRCAEVTGPETPLKVVTRERPRAPTHGLLVRTSYAGICHSEVHFIKDAHVGWVAARREILKSKGHYPGNVLGHEGGGEVEEVGEGVPRDCPVKVGDQVLVFPFIGCQECETCKGGQSNLCENNSMCTVDIGNGSTQGSYSTHIPLPSWEYAVKVPDNISMEMASILPCCALTSWVALDKAEAAIERAIRLRQKANLLIIGAGGLGTWGILLAKMRFKNVLVTCSDVSDDKLSNAKDIGADKTVLWRRNLTTDELISLTTESGENKMDAVIDFVGTPHTASAGFGCLHKGSTLVLIGLHGGDFQVPIPILIAKTINVQGSRTGGLPDLRRLVDFLSTTKLKCPPMEFYRLEDINEAVDKVYEGKMNGRAILKFVD